MSMFLFSKTLRIELFAPSTIQKFSSNSLGYITSFQKPYNCFARDWVRIPSLESPSNEGREPLIL